MQTLRLRLILPLAAATLGFCSASCAPLTAPDGPFARAAEESVINDVTTAGKTLADLPPAKERPVVAVYSFEDKTGQRKPSDDAAQYSSAVTQGGVDILTKALLDAARGGWFRVAERGGLDGLTKERQIIRMMRDQYAAPDGRRLPPPRPMLYAGVLLDGGVIAYESNVLTGGIGARYLGVGGDVKYRRDVVTVNLRAVSVQTGEVLLSVNAAKTIYSSGVSAGVFKFVAFDKLLEAESGFTYNEPPQLAVRQAVEAAVHALIMEGYARRMWAFADAEAGKRAYQAYRRRLRGQPESAAGSVMKTASAPDPLPPSKAAPAKEERVLFLPSAGYAAPAPGARLTESAPLAARPAEPAKPHRNEEERAAQAAARQRKKREETENAVAAGATERPQSPLGAEQEKTVAPRHEPDYKENDTTALRRPSSGVISAP